MENDRPVFRKKVIPLSCKDTFHNHFKKPFFFQLVPSSSAAPLSEEEQRFLASQLRRWLQEQEASASMAGGVQRRSSSSSDADLIAGLMQRRFRYVRRHWFHIKLCSKIFQTINRKLSPLISFSYIFCKTKTCFPTFENFL